MWRTATAVAQRHTGVVGGAAIQLLIWLFPRRFEPPAPACGRGFPYLFKEGAEFHDRTDPGA